MTTRGDEQDPIRQYLLGKLSGEDREAFERRLFTEDELVEEIPSAEDELIDDYLIGDLSVDEAAMFERNFLVTDERRQKVRLGKALRTYAKAHAVRPKPVPSPAPWNWQQLFSSSLVRAAAFAAVILIVSVGVWRIFFYESEVDKGLLALKNAYREQRPVEARITQFDYAPFIASRGRESNNVNEAQLRLAEATLLTALNNKPTPAVRHALGKVYLAKQNFEQAIEYLNQAVKDDSTNAQFYSDLGAAYLEKAKADLEKGANPNNSEAGKGMEDLGHSLQALNKALELNPNSLEALFNRAIVYQEMLLLQQAKDDWKKYLEKDPNSKWSNEARQRLNSLDEPKKTSRTKEELLQDYLTAYAARDDEKAWQVISTSREALSRKLIWEQLLDGYLDASLQGRTDEADNKLQALLYEADLELKRAGDRYVSGLAHFYQSSSEKERQMLANGRRLMKQGHEYYFQHQMDKAADSYAEAGQIFTGVQDVWESEYAQHWLAYSYYEQGKTEQSLSILEELAGKLQKDSHQWLLMRTLHLSASGYHNQNEFSKAINYNRRALSLAERIDDKIGIFNASSILIFQLNSTGNNREAFEQVQRSLSVMLDCPLNEIQLARHYTILALAFDSAEFYDAAIAYQKEALTRAIAMGNIQHISLDYARLGLMYAKVKNFGEAFRNLNLAYTTAQSHADEIPRKEMMAFSALQTGHLYREQGDFKNAISSYNQSIALSDQFHFKYDVYEAHKNRLFCYLATGDYSSGEEELKTTLDLAEKYRSTIVQGDNRNSFFDIQQSVYDLAINFAYSKLNDPQKAFQYSEDSRARSLLDSVSGHSDVAQPLKLADIQQRLPDKAQILQYSILSDKLILWVISKQKFSTVEKKITQRELESKVLHYISIVNVPGNKTEELRSSGQELFDILIRPAESLLDKDKLVYVVPDRSLNALPFNTLISSTTGKYLLEDYSLAVSPSSSLLVILSEIADRKGVSRDERLLSVGNPSFDHDEFPSLSDLPSAAAEAEQVASCYRSAALLVGSNATLERVTTEMPKSDVIHFAVHAVNDDRSPAHSRLVLAKDSTAISRGQTFDGSLQADDVYQMKLERTRLAVLSACETGAERYYGGEGMVSLARPFLAAGVPLVIVSFWPVDSDPTAELMITFHKHRTQDKLSSVEALRRAQLEMLKSPNERFQAPFFWGAFASVGGFTSF